MVSFDIDFVSRLAKLETSNKHLFRPASNFHKWWAKRCGTTFRALLKHVSGVDSSYYDDTRCLEGKVVLDPMCGSGTTLHEALRLGARVVGSDIDPLAFAISLAGILEVNPNKLDVCYENLLAELTQHNSDDWAVACSLCGEDSELSFTLHGRQVESTDGRKAVLMKRAVLLQNRNGNGSIRLAGGEQTKRGDSVVTVPYELIFKDQLDKSELANWNWDVRKPMYLRFTPVVDKINCPNCSVVFQCSSANNTTHRNDEVSMIKSEFVIQPGPKSNDLINHGVSNFLDVFSRRQLNIANTLCRAVRDSSEDVKLHFALLASTSMEFNSMLCGYKGWKKSRPGAVRHVFSHHAFSIPYTALENNPLQKGYRSGTISYLYNNRLKKGVEWREQPKERQMDQEDKWTNCGGSYSLKREEISTEMGNHIDAKGTILNIDSRLLSLNEEVDFVVTDPPYHDSVQYTNLSQYFRVWLKYLLPDLNWSISSVETMSEKASKLPGEFGHILGEVFVSSSACMKPDGKLCFTYHDLDPKSWSELAKAIRMADLYMEQAIIIQAENEQSVHIANQKSLKHDALMIFSREKRKNLCLDCIDEDFSSLYTSACAKTLFEVLRDDELNEYEDFLPVFTGIREDYAN